MICTSSLLVRRTLLFASSSTARVGIAVLDQSLCFSSFPFLECRLTQSSQQQSSLYLPQQRHPYSNSISHPFSSRSGSGSYRGRGGGGGGGGNKKGFRARRRPGAQYRPIQPGPKRVKDPSPNNDAKFVELKGLDNMKAPYGPMVQDALEGLHQQHKRRLLNQDSAKYDQVEEEMRMMDYFLAEDGSTEDRVMERRLLANDFDNEEDKMEFLNAMDRLERDANVRDMGLDQEYEKHVQRYMKESKDRAEKNTRPYRSPDEDDGRNDHEPEEYDAETTLDHNSLVYGNWAEMMIAVDRNVKLWRGGRLESYRALVIGGNMNGCGGFGVGKSKSPIDAVAKASRHCKRNIFFVDRHQGDSLTRDLVGTQNNCKVVIRSVRTGLRGNPLAKEILKRFGIINAQIKAHGRRTPLNVVQATFKALLTHESLEEIALKQGKRLVSLERSMRLGI